jgi:hypothetical protein
MPNVIQKRTCVYCHWFRPYQYHAPDSPPISLSKTSHVNRGCTYGWEYHEEVENLPPFKWGEEFNIDGQIVKSDTCAVWRDCGWWDKGIMKSTYVTLNKDDLDKLKKWFSDHNIPYEE